MATILFDVDAFRAQFPGLFPDPPNTDALIETMWDAATCYVSTDTAGSLSVECRTQVLNLVTAHLLSILESAQAGNQPGFLVSGSIDKISVSVQPPPNKNAFQFFLMQTTFGVQAYSMLYAAGVGGLYVGGFNELGSFRRAGGVFSPPSPATLREGVVDCAVLLTPPPDPVTIDYGEIADGTGVQFGVTIEPDCELFLAEFTTAVTGKVINPQLYTASAVDDGKRYNMYYWDASDRNAGNPPTNVFLSINPTGLDFSSGFGAIVISGNPALAANLFVITGRDSATADDLFFRIFNAG